MINSVIASLFLLHLELSYLLLMRQPRFLFFGFFNSMESAFPYEENISVQPNPVRRRLSWRRPPYKALFLRPEAPCLSSGPSLRRPGRGASPSAKPYFFVRKHHATWVRLSLRRLGRGASPSAKPYFFVRKHHVLRPNGPAGAADVVPHTP